MIRKVIAHPGFKQLVRYGVVGLTNNAIGYSAYLLLTWLGVPYKIAMTLLYAIAVTISFYGNRRWVFTYKGNMRRAAIKFVCAHALGYLLNLLMLYIFADHMGYKHQYVQAASIFVVAAFLFVMFRFIVFRHNEVQPELSR